MSGINGLMKFGYILVGFGAGVFASSYVLEHELNKPIGEVENYIPLEDRDEDDEESDDIHSKAGAVSKQSDRQSQTDILEDTRSAKEGRDNGRGGNSRRESSEDRSHSEFGSSQADLLRYYSNPEGSLGETKPKRTFQDALNGPTIIFNGKRVAVSEDEYREFIGADDNDSEGQDTDMDEAKGSKDDGRRKDFEKMRAEGIANMKNRYSQMYRDDLDLSGGSEDMTDILHEVNSRTNTRESYNDNGSEYDSYEADHPEDDEPEEYEYEPEIDIHDEYTLEQIEGKFEIFLDDNPQDFVTLIYYAGDYTLCDDGEQIIPDPEDVVGMAALNRLIEGGPGVQNNVIYVHNMKTSINYEVVLDGSSYKETVMGIFDDEYESSSNYQRMRSGPGKPRMKNMNNSDSSRLRNGGRRKGNGYS